MHARKAKRRLFKHCVGRMDAVARANAAYGDTRHRIVDRSDVKMRQFNGTSGLLERRVAQRTTFDTTKRSQRI